MNSIKEKSVDWQKRTKKKTINLAIWTSIWVATVAVATFGPKFIWGENTIINLLAILLSTGIGVGMIIANIKQIKEQDEMMQKVQLEAMGISLGVAVVGGISFSMLDVTNLIPFDAEIGYLIIIIGVTYLISMAINMKRYK